MVLYPGAVFPFAGSNDQESSLKSITSKTDKICILNTKRMKTQSLVRRFHG